MLATPWPTGISQQARLVGLELRQAAGYRSADDAEQWGSEIETTAADPAESGEGPQGGGYARG